ncbi:hypothetical protein NDN08_006317 [Rhodosorus marinus]|uniref:Elongin-A n=1 Tax=Rhodosorus marinus TaxID=101924 RepID=A0AAV8UNG2_9RHOD|nr:hypothetical protein NDN08_006317 [Rhodosorus marinus]
MKVEVLAAYLEDSTGEEELERKQTLETGPGLEDDQLGSDDLCPTRSTDLNDEDIFGSSVTRRSSYDRSQRRNSGTPLNDEDIFGTPSAAPTRRYDLTTSPTARSPGAAHGPRRPPRKVNSGMHEIALGGSRRSDSVGRKKRERRLEPALGTRTSEHARRLDHACPRNEISPTPLKRAHVGRESSKKRRLEPPHSGKASFPTAAPLVNGSVRSDRTIYGLPRQREKVAEEFGTVVWRLDHANGDDDESPPPLAELCWRRAVAHSNKFGYLGGIPDDYVVILLQNVTAESLKHIEQLNPLNIRACDAAWSRIIEEKHGVKELAPRYSHWRALHDEKEREKEDRLQAAARRLRESAQQSSNPNRPKIAILSRPLPVHKRVRVSSLSKIQRLRHEIRSQRFTRH